MREERKEMKGNKNRGMDSYERGTKKDDRKKRKKGRKKDAVGDLAKVLFPRKSSLCPVCKKN